MSLSEFYDWIVLGDHPGALLSANLAAGLGLSVLVLPMSSTQKVVFSKNGQCFDPEPNFLTGLSPDGLLWESLAKISALPSEEDLMSEGAFPQVLTPDRRLALSASSEYSAIQLSREFPEGANERNWIEHSTQSLSVVLDYWKRFPNRLTIKLGPDQKYPAKETPTSWEDLLKKLELRHEELDESDLTLALGYGVTAQSLEKMRSSEWAHAVALGLSGAAIRGGMSAYRRMLLRSAKKLGATVLEDVECRRIFGSNRRFMGVQVSAGGNMISATGCVLGASVSDFAEQISFTGPEWLRKGARVNPPVGWRFTLAITVRDEALAPGVSRRMIWKEPDAPYLEMELADPAEYGNKEPGHKILFLRSILPLHVETLGRVYQKRIAARMFRLATEVIPFLEKHVTRIYPNFDFVGFTMKHSSDPLHEFHEVYGFDSIEKIPENLRVYERNNSTTAMSSGTGIEGLFVASGESIPELGPLGPTVAALEATAWVAHRSGLPGPLASLITMNG